MIPNRKRFRSAKNYVLALLSEAGAPALRLMATARQKGEISKPRTWKRGVILGADHIGDIMYNTASLPALKAGLSDCEWFYVADAPTSEILAHNPHLAGTISSADFKSAAEAFDVALCYNSASTWRELLMTTLLGIPNRVGYPDKGFSALVTFPLQVHYPQPYPAYFRDLVGQLINCKADWPLRPLIYPEESNRNSAQKLISELRFDSERPIVACFATGRQQSGIWPPRQFAKTLAHLETQDQVQTALCGTAADRSLLEKLKTEFGVRAHIVAGELDLLSLACFLEQCVVVICPDSGPRHLANAVRTPALFIRNLAVGRIETGVYCDTEIDLAPDMENLSPQEQKAAFHLIKPDDVAQRVISVLNDSGRNKKFVSSSLTS